MDRRIDRPHDGRRAVASNGRRRVVGRRAAGRLGVVRLGAGDAARGHVRGRCRADVGRRGVRGRRGSTVESLAGHRTRASRRGGPARRRRRAGGWSLRGTSALGAQLGNTDTIVRGGAELGLWRWIARNGTEADEHLAPAAGDDRGAPDARLCRVDARFAAAARIALHRGDLAGANRHLARAMRGRPSCTYAFPWLAVRVRLQLAKVYSRWAT